MFYHSILVSSLLSPVFPLIAQMLLGGTEVY